jgi:hypothetical protein
VSRRGIVVSRRALARRTPLLLRLFWTIAIGLALLVQLEPARAAALDLVGLDQLQQYVTCTERCALGSTAKKTSCLQTCGTAPAAWNKNLDSVVNRKDSQLALLEYQDFGTLTKICYQAGAVVPKGQCAPPSCSGTACQDNDHDGLQAWQEALVGTSDNTAQRLCSTGSECAGFAEQCSYQAVLDLSYCRARTSTSAFHLDLIEENASQVVVAVVFDYSPVPPTVLDLYLQFNGSALTLSESRALAAATLSGKSVEVRQPQDNLLRIIALGVNDTRPIEPGPIAELVFVRKSTSASQLQFSNVPELRQAAMAPSLGAQQVGLRDDSAWGTAVSVNDANSTGEGRVLLHYDFESDERPLAVSAALKSVDVCSSVRLAGSSSMAGICPAAPVPVNGVVDPTQKQLYDRWISELDTLQRGTVLTTRSMPGVNGLGRWLDGVKDHLELPLTFKRPAAGANFLEADQGFSLSFWMFQSPNAKGEQVLFSRSDQSSELTKIALLSRPTASDPKLFELVWLNGAIGDTTPSRRAVVQTSLPTNRWTHVGLNVDAAQHLASVYVDGVLATPKDANGVPTYLVLAAGAFSGAVTSCGQILDVDKTRLALHEEGDIVGINGAGAESIYVGASGSNGLFGVDQMDTNGLGRRPIVRAGDSSARDPDYNPALDRVVYASDASGNTEIWIANGDGSHPRPITVGFGSAADGVFARHPRWAPDGSAIVFESNAYAISPPDNAKFLGSHLYYIGYDVQQNDVAIPLSNNTIVKQLDYQTRVTSNDIAQYRLTRTDEEVDNVNPQWLSGSSGNAELKLGELAFSTADRTGLNPRVRRVRIAKSYRLGSDAAKELLPYLTNEAFAPLITNRRLLAARATRAVGQPLVERALLAQQSTVNVPAPEISADIAPGGTCSVGTPYQVSFRYSSPTPNPKCWDKDGNNACDAFSEDRNGDGLCTVLDCNAFQLEGVLATFDSTQSTAITGVGVQPGAWLAANGKQLLVKPVFGTTTASVRVEVSSPVNNLPIPNGTLLATVQFCRAQPTFTFTKQQTGQSYSVVRTETPVGATAPTVTSSPFTLSDLRLQAVTAAEFSPDLKRLALAVIFDSRPMLFRTAKDVNGTAGADLITSQPVRAEGLSWSGVSRLLSCNWLGASRDSFSKLYANAFQGALDEVKLFDYVRPAKGYQSESARGHERLQKEGREGAIPDPVKQCTADSECQATELCNAGKCAVITCVPTDTSPCARGRCQRLSLETSPVERYACVTECNSDPNCFDKQCAHGPCAVCSQQTHTCGECQSVVEDIGGLKIEHIEGCPDRNSFSCDRGTCVSECYSFSNGQTKYTCDPATEYCRAGRCALFDWNWADFSPVSFASAGEMVRKGAVVTAAASQLYPIEIKAFGVTDNALAPEILVEAKAPNVFNGSWFDVSRITVFNETSSDADSKPYTVGVPYPITNLRIRLIAPAYANLTGGATGALRGGPSELCALGGDACRFVPIGSASMLGYEAWIPGNLSPCVGPAASCNQQQLFLQAGRPGVVVRAVSVGGAGGTPQLQSPSAGWTNKICPYWNGTMAVDYPANPTSGAPYRMIFGDASRESSNQKRAYYPSAPSSSLVPFDATNKMFGVLNCNYVADDGTPAGLELAVQGVTYPNPSLASVEYGKTTETFNGCTAKVGDPNNARYVPCYEWVGGDVSMDPFTSEPLPYRSLGLARFRSFGWGSPGDNRP